MRMILPYVHCLQCIPRVAMHRKTFYLLNTLHACHYHWKGYWDHLRGWFGELSQSSNRVQQWTWRHHSLEGSLRSKMYPYAWWLLGHPVEVIDILKRETSKAGARRATLDSLILLCWVCHQLKSILKNEKRILLHR